ncbi:diaminopimelate decarboxylase [Halorientalis regularis]|uniref:Diaminopimelate decarboxylase n=1 Tax=Halorientalis regularis TaxID=660518 RepID=A0A1G7ISH2_9EURY|nr:diaminopimelate decarboxylase [Halorientalis regularis]SDF15548.1 diaminopimelate decarboxylase [Halorientalis regularis]
MTTGSAVRRLSAWDAERLRGLAEEYETPLYVYDLERVRDNAARLQSAFDEEEISYAIKANTTRPVLSTIEATGVGAECASAGEVERALAAGFDGADVRYTAVNPPARDLDYVVDTAADEDLIVTVGAADTLDQLAERGFSGRLCIRANPGVGAGHHEKVSTGAAPKFGVPLDRVPDLAAEAVDRGFDLVGLHAHAGSGISGGDLEAHRELVARMGELSRTVIADVGNIEFVNVGGGLGVPYREDQAPLDLDAVAAATRDAFGDVDARLGIEPGRYFVADAGVLLTRVNTVKPTPETTVVGVDAGMTTLVRPAMYDSYHAIRSLAADARTREPVSATVAGPICETADVLGEDRSLPDPERDDLLVVGNAGAYGYEMSSNYNSRPRPAAVALEGDEARLAVRREAVADITGLETWSE